MKVEINKKKMQKIQGSKLGKIIEKIPKLKDIVKLKNKDIIKNKNIIFKIIKELKLEQLNLNAIIGLQDKVALSLIIALLDIIISIFLTKRMNGNDTNNYYYNITPSKTNDFYLNLSINCIIALKIANIINIIKRERGNKNERTSNRIFNGNCYE